MKISTSRIDITMMGKETDFNLSIPKTNFKLLGKTNAQKKKQEQNNKQEFNMKIAKSKKKIVIVIK